MKQLLLHSTLYCGLIGLLAQDLADKPSAKVYYRLILPTRFYYAWVHISDVLEKKHFYCLFQSELRVSPNIDTLNK